MQNRCHTDRLSFFLYYGSGGSSSTIFATASDGPRGGIALASDKRKQEARGVDCNAGLDELDVQVIVVMAAAAAVVRHNHRTHVLLFITIFLWLLICVFYHKKQVLEPGMSPCETTTKILSTAL